jgi:hypothetical protein
MTKSQDVFSNDYTVLKRCKLENSHELIKKTLRRFRYDCRWHIADYFNSYNFFQNPDNVFRGIHPESNLVCFPEEAKIVTSGLEAVTGPEDNWKRALHRIQEKIGASLS